MSEWVRMSLNPLSSIRKFNSPTPSNLLSYSLVQICLCWKSCKVLDPTNYCTYYKASKCCHHLWTLIFPTNYGLWAGNHPLWLALKDLRMSLSNLSGLSRRCLTQMDLQLQHCCHFQFIPKVIPLSVGALSYRVQKSYSNRRICHTCTCHTSTTPAAVIREMIIISSMQAFSTSDEHSTGNGMITTYMNT